MPNRRFLLAGIAPFALAAVLSACSDSADSDPTATTTATSANSSATVAPSATPAPMPPVVASMLSAISSGRALAAPPTLAAAVISRDELPAVLEAALTEEDHRWFDEMTTLYQLLGYLGEDDDYYSIYMTFAKEAVIGLYVPETDQLYVVTDDGRGFDDLTANERETLAHEIVHALQDYNFDLAATFDAISADRDRDIAYTAVVEGDATTHEGLGNDRRGLLPGGRFFALADFARATQITAPIERELRFPYTTGADWIAGMKAQGGTAAIDDLLREPPSGTAVILHPERGARWEPENVALPDIAGELGSGWERQSGGTFGEFNWMNLLQTRLRGLDAAEAAAGWGGDRYDIYVQGGEAVAAFSVKGSPELQDGVEDWLREDADVEASGGVLAASFSDGRSARFVSTPDGFVLVLGNSEAAVEGAFDILARG